MALDHIPGIAPEILTVSASPAPTSTTFTVSSATNLVAGQWLNIEVGGTLERGKISSIAGNQITLVSALSAAPDVPGEVRNTRELITISDTQKLGVYNALTGDEAAGGDMTYLPAGVKIHVPGLGIYRLSSATGITPDGKYTLDAAGSTNEHLLEVLGTEAAEELIQAHAGALLNQIEELQAEIDTLTALPAGAVRTSTWIFQMTAVASSSLAASTDLEIVLTPAPTLIPDLRGTDALTVTPAPLLAGLAQVGAWISAGAIIVRLRNTSGGAITPGLLRFTIKLERPVE